MKTRSILVLALLALALPILALTSKAQQKPEDLDQKSTEAWLALTDSGKYPESWDEAAQSFENAVSRDQWVNQIKPVRSPPGKVVSRKLKSATYTKALPGAPRGEYVILQYETNFENRPSSLETLAPMLDKDGKWRVSGYYIK